MSILKLDAAVPPFETVWSTGEAATLAGLNRGKTLLLCIIKAECPVCRLLAPFVERLHRQLTSPQFAVAGVIENTAEQARQFAKNYDLTFPLALDLEPCAISAAYQISSVPMTFLVNDQGMLERSIAGFHKAQLEELAGEIARRTGHGQYQLFGPTDQVPVFKPG